ncbi:MAG: putative zinc-binding peptidase [Planctomycetes bacterium]|nr:putative zinc-binding peptidase [Planctomycetota bacterium]
MQIFVCQSCKARVFFENYRCLTCNHELGYLPDPGTIAALEPVDDDTFAALGDSAATWRKCRNYGVEGACNWMVRSDDTHELCESCRLTRTRPDLSVAGNRTRWILLEAAKRRLVYSLRSLGLPRAGLEEDPSHGLAFDLIASTSDEPAITGHDHGIITINIAEADDEFREKQRVRLGERYRTLLGHFRHESGHHYWDLLIDGSRWHEPYRALFGDESIDYQQAMKQHYDAGGKSGWQDQHVSAYASMHPWEDWAETWAHYLHGRDTLEIAAQLNLTVKAPDGSTTRVTPAAARSFDEMITAWMPITFALNSLNRGMGLPDWYPFVLSPTVLAKLRFVHDVVVATASEAEAAPAAAAAQSQDLGQSQSQGSGQSQTAS